MTEDELVAQLVADIGDVKLALLRTDLGVEHHVEQHVAQFLANLVIVFTNERVAELKDLLYGVGA